MFVSCWEHRGKALVFSLQVEDNAQSRFQEPRAFVG